jgi:hypothetical protein
MLRKSASGQPVRWRGTGGDKWVRGSDCWRVRGAPCHWTIVQIGDFALFTCDLEKGFACVFGDVNSPIPVLAVITPTTVRVRSI